MEPSAKPDRNRANPPSRPTVAAHKPPAEVAEIVERCLGPFASTLLDRTAQPFLVIGLDGQFVRANRAFCDLLGYSPEDLLGKSVMALTPPRWHEATRRAKAELLQHGVPLRYEKEYYASDGHTVPVELVADLFLDERGQAIGYFAFMTDMTERNRARDALRVSENRFRQLFEEAPFGYHEIDPEGTIVEINQAECEMLGYDRDELIGTPIYNLVEESQRDDARRAVAEKLSGRRPLVPFERIFRRRDGQTFVASIRDRLIVSESGEVVGLRSTVQDITEQKQMEAALISSERRSRALFEGIDDAVFVHDLSGRILDANPAATRLLGYSREEFLRLRTDDIDADDFAQGFEERLEQQLRHGHLACEGRHRSKDGRIIPVEIKTSVIQLEDQTAVLAVIRDMSERLALDETRRQFAEAQLRNARDIQEKNRELAESEARYRMLTEASLDAVVVADAETRINLFNAAAEKAFGYPADEVLGKPLELLLNSPGGACSREELRADLSREEPHLVGRTVELTGRRKGGEEFPLELSMNAVALDGCTQYIGAIRDLTERQRMRAMLVQSEKLASIGLLSAGVAHEINNPLAYVANNLAVLERDLKGVYELIECYESAREQLRTVAPETLARVDAVAEEIDWEYVRGNLGRLISKTREGVQRVASIVQNLRGIARTGPTRKEEVQLGELIASAIEMAHGQLRRSKIEVKVEVQEGMRKIPCVPNQITQVLLNLLINAAQAIQATGRPEGGTIRVSASSKRGAQVVEVADDGCGIEEEHLPRLFDPFFTTKPVGEGTGLGLAISHGIVSGHGGQIEVESRPGKGSLFRITLPTSE